MTWRRRLNDLARHSPELFMLVGLAVLLAAAATAVALVLMLV